MIYSYEIEGIRVETGDIICTQDGDNGNLSGQFWWLIGRLIPGDVDHIVIYVGPGGRCVEAGSQGKVITFDIPGNKWDPMTMRSQRGFMIDTFYGVARPLEGKGLSAPEIARVREQVAAYCLKQAKLQKPYNLNFLDSSTEKRFYCSQLAYKGYLRHGIDLNTGQGVPHIPGTSSILFPQEIWSGSPHESPGP